MTLNLIITVLLSLRQIKLDQMAKCQSVLCHSTECWSNIWLNNAIKFNAIKLIFYYQQIEKEFSAWNWKDVIDFLAHSEVNNCSIISRR
jgi:hypothetical protein